MKISSRGRTLGKVISVTADRFVIELSSTLDSFTLVGFDDQHYVARIGTFIMIPLQAEYIIGEITGLRDSDLAKNNQLESEIQDTQALVSIKYLDVVPVGTLPIRQEGAFRFGVSVYPPLYSDALYAQTSDLDRILDVSETNNISDIGDRLDSPIVTTAFTVGTSAIFDDYAVKARIDEFFGGHSAILGNTGSGKSCTVASIIQSIFTKESAFQALGASFVIFDTNGEYRQAFSKLPPPIKRFYSLVPQDGQDTTPPSTDDNELTMNFRLPHWFMSIEEWGLLLRASDKTQQPILRIALGLTSIFSNNDAELTELRDHVLASACLAILRNGDSVPASSHKIISLLTAYHTPKINLEVFHPLLEHKYGDWDRNDNEQGKKIYGNLEECLLENVILPDYQNRIFEFNDLGEAIELAILYEESHGNRQIRDYCSSLLTRFKSIRDRPEYAFMRLSTDKLRDHEKSIESFVDFILGISQDPAQSSQITILDMNEIEDEIVEVISAVVARLIFERLRRLQERNSQPVNLVLEEAHRYISDKPSSYAIDASHIFERISKEGRKYGLFILLASQRPSELSRTVLSQCSNFIIHRIQNPEDLMYVKQMTPFISESVLRRLPALPKQHALIFGNAVNIPTTFRVREADPRPKSDDAQIGKIWFIPDPKTVAHNKTDR